MTAHFSSTFQLTPVQPAPHSAEDALPAGWGQSSPATHQQKIQTNFNTTTQHTMNICLLTHWHQLLPIHITQCLFVWFFTYRIIQMFNCPCSAQKYIQAWGWQCTERLVHSWHENTPITQRASQMLYKVLLPASSLEMGRCMLTGCWETLYGRTWRMCLHM